MSCILLIEDDLHVLAALQRCLRVAGHRVVTATEGGAGLDLARHELPELVILDLDLPDQSGFEVCRKLRCLPHDPAVFILTGRDSVDDRVRGLDVGADDYFAKPIDVRELLARVRALLRRRIATPDLARVLDFGGATFDFEKRSAVRGGVPLALTKSEFALLELLARSPGKATSRQVILEVVLGYARAAETRAADTLVWRLRKKIGDSGPAPRWIKSVPGGGYFLDLPKPAAGGL